MVRRSRLVGYYGLVLLGALVVFTLAYQYGMTALEDRPRSLLRSLEVVVQTFTTVGYGEDAPWSSPAMNLLVIGMQSAGIILIFTALPVFVVPLLEDALATTPPTSVENTSDHVLVCVDTPRNRAFVAELESRDVEYVIIEPDREMAIELHEAAYPVIHGDPELTSTLQNARIEAASAVVADASDEVNASIALAVQEVDRDVPVLTIADDPGLTDYHRYAGAGHVLSPRRLLGETLANEALSSVSTNIGSVLDLDESFTIVTLPIGAESGLVGETLADSTISGRTGATVIGAWLDDEFVSPPPAETVLDEQTRLLVLGRDAQLRSLEALTGSAARSYDRRDDRGTVLIVGFGEVGSAAAETLTAADVPWNALDRAERPEVDIACDATDPAALRAAALDEADTVLLALGEDTQALFATLIIRELNPDVEIIARANEGENVRKLYRAGADRVFGLAEISGRMIAAEILGDEGLRRIDEQLDIVRRDVSELAGQSLLEAQVRSRTGATIIAVERDSDVITGITPSFTVQAGDEAIVAGTAKAIDRLDSLVQS